MAYFIFATRHYKIAPVPVSRCQSVKLAEATLKSLIHVSFRAFHHQHSLNIYSSENRFEQMLWGKNEV
jgi:hypothetical protein